VHKPKSINELMRTGGKRLAALKVRTQARNATLEHVCAALPPPLARTVVSAGLEGGQLTVGVSGAAWAARLRYSSDVLRLRVGSALGADIQRVRIKVVPPRAGD
jgi:hypothetical protein